MGTRAALVCYFYIRLYANLCGQCVNWKMPANDKRILGKEMKSVKGVKGKTPKKPKKYPVRRIPRHKLDEALALLKDDSSLDDFYKQHSSCIPPIHMAGEVQTLTHPLMIKLRDARDCVMQRDWTNLAKLLSQFNPTSDPYYGFYIGFVTKYASMMLAHGDEKLLSVLSQSVLRKDDHEGLLMKQTIYP